MEWVRMPSSWITNQDNPGLKMFSVKDAGNAIAALILYIALVHKANDRKQDDPAYGFAESTYDELMDITYLSRAMIARGLKQLEDCKLIGHVLVGRRKRYEIKYNDRPWGKLPKQYFEQKNIFAKFQHRNRTELIALKLYLLFIAFRSEKLNAAVISYPKIHAYTGISENVIRSGLSSLVNIPPLIHIDRFGSAENSHGNSPSYYRISGISSRRHIATMKKEYFFGDPAFDSLEDLL